MGSPFSSAIATTLCAHLCTQTHFNQPAAWLINNKSTLSIEVPWVSWQREGTKKSLHIEDLWCQHMVLSYQPFIKYIKMSRTNNKPCQDHCVQECACLFWLSTCCTYSVYCSCLQVHERTCAYTYVCVVAWLCKSKCVRFGFSRSRWKFLLFPLQKSPPTIQQRVHTAWQWKLKQQTMTLLRLKSI